MDYTRLPPPWSNAERLYIDMRYTNDAFGQIYIIVGF